MTDQQAVELCDRLRRRLIDSVSRTGGHLSSNLGAVELTVAVHRVFDLSRDRLVFDVGHQCYCHKLLTGREGAMDTLRAFGGLSGFPRPGESPCDAFIAGHASNSVSVALGMARARSLGGEDYSVLALIGDGALTGGLSYEGLTNAGHSGEPLIVILNDNGMSITRNVGGVADYLARRRLKPQYLRFKKLYRSLTGHGPVGRGIYRFTHAVKQAIKGALLPCSMFEDMGFSYVGPADGHDVVKLTELLRYARDLKCPVVVHVKTQKGRGYPPAEREPERFHGVGPFDPDTGAERNPGGRDFSAVFGQTMRELGRENPRVYAITAAMPAGTGLDGFASEFPDRYSDVGIAEGHAAAMAGGLARQGMIPVFAVYSTFLQRAYDMLLHDVAIQGLHAVFAVDRAGLVGPDGETHQGIFDVAYLSSVPGMAILCPASFAELRGMLRYAVERLGGPAAVRYPRGGEGAWRADGAPVGTQVVRRGEDLAIVTYGTLVDEALAAAEGLEREGVSARVLKLQSIRPLDMAPILEAVRDTGRLVVAEECVAAGCVGRTIAANLLEAGVPARAMALVNLGDRFIPQGTVPQLRRLCGIDADSIRKRAREVLERG